MSLPGPDAPVPIAIADAALFPMAPADGPGAVDPERPPALKSPPKSFPVLAAAAAAAAAEARPK